MTEQVRPSPRSPEVRETHAGVVILIGDVALKVKKPVNFGFLDFSTPDKRRKALQRELELNRRLAPEVYKGVYTLCDEAGRLVEPVLVMTRMPSDRSLEAMALSGQDIDACVRAVARKVADFHARCADSSSSKEIARAGSLEAIQSKWRESFADLRRFVPDLFAAEILDEIEDLAISYLDGRERLLAERIREGEIKDGHGDLLTSDIFCVDSRPEILDCIEFDDSYRYCDVASDTAFLAMDLIRLGRSREARLFLEEYVQASRRPIPYTLLEHYISYRACVRTKVAALSYEQGKADMAVHARALLDITRDHGLRTRPLLVVVGGPPGTGKSSLAAAIQSSDSFAAAVGGRPRFEVFRSDVVRKEVAGIEPSARCDSGVDAGIYTAQFTARTYAEIGKRAEEELEMGRSVILDATFSDAELREIPRRVARSTGAVLVELHCQAPLEVCRTRIEQRLARGGDASEANVEVAEVISGRFDQWPTAQPIDTSASLDESVAEAIAAIQRSMGASLSWS